MCQLPTCRRAVGYVRRHVITRGRHEVRFIPRMTSGVGYFAISRRCFSIIALRRGLGGRPGRACSPKPSAQPSQVSLEPGEVFLEPGELIENIYFPLTGLISLMVIGTDGNFIETSTVGREGAVGLHSGLGRRRSFTRATAQIGGKFSTVRAARFEHVANGSAPIRNVILHYTEVLWAETQRIAA